MTTEIDYEGAVKGVYPDAIAEIHGVHLCICMEPFGDVIGHSYKEFSLAWENAYTQLKQQGKL